MGIYQASYYCTPPSRACRDVFPWRRPGSPFYMQVVPIPWGRAAMYQEEGCFSPIIDTVGVRCECSVRNNMPSWHSCNTIRSEQS